MKMTEKWLTIDQIAEYLQVSREKLYKLCQKGRIPVSKVVRRLVSLKTHL